MKFLRKGFALFAGLMLLSNVFLPSAVVFAEEGTPLAATEQVNQVAQAEATASVEENSTPEVSPEKVASESSEALAPETPKAEEVNENSAETTVQEAKEEQKAEPVSDLATSSEPKKTEPASESDEERGETSILAQQGGGDAGSSDGAVVTPEVKQSIEEKNSKMVSQPSIELREVTAKSDWASKRTVSFYGYDVEVDENNKVTITPEMENFLKTLDSDVQEVLAAELLSIESENVLFVHTKKGKNKPTKVFPENKNSTLKGKFKGNVTKNIVTLKAQWDDATIVAPSWVDTTKLSNEKRAGFHTVTINGKEAFTVKTDDFGWFYVAKKIEKPSQPTQPTIKTETFYTSNDKDFPVAMKDEKVVDIEESKKLLQKALPGITKEEDKKLAEEFIAKATDDDVEIKTIHNQRLLFVKVNDHTTKVFRDSRDPLFKNAFKHTKAIVGEPVNVDLENSISPKWISDREKYEITHFVKIEDKGYTLLTVSGHWFYAPVKFNIVNFYGSNNKPFKVVMQDQNTVDLERTKELLVPEIPRLPVDLQEEAEDFAKN